MGKLTSRIRNLFKHEFTRSFLVLFSGSSIAQTIPLFATIILARFFDTNSFGILFLYSTTVILLSIISTLKYELAIVLPKNEIEAINLLSLSILICFLISILLLIVIIVFIDQITNAFDNKNFRYWLYFVPVSVLFSGILQSTNNWFLWQKEYKKISFSQINKSATTATGQLATGFSNVTGIGLIPGLILGQFSAAAVNLVIIFKGIRSKLKHISWNKMYLLAIKHKNLPFFSTLLGFSNALSNQLPILLLTRYFGLTATSYYGMAHRLIGAPMGLISNSVSKIFFKKSTEVYNDKKDLTLFIKQTYLNLFKVGIIPFLLLFLLAPFLIKLILGSEWEPVATYLRILIPWLFFMFLTSPLTHIVTLLNKQKPVLLYDILLLTCRFLALFIGYKVFNDVLISLMLFSFVGVLFNLILFKLLIKYSKETNS